MDAPAPGWTQTQSPGDVIRRIAAELELADPRKAWSTMAQHWPEAMRRLEALSIDRSTSLYALMARALASGVEQIEWELRG